MTKISKIMALTALISLVFGIAVIDNAVAGERVKGRTVWYTVKWEQINVPGEEGHIIAASDSKGITSNMEGKTFADGWIIESVGLWDLNFKAGLGSAHGYGEWADKNGDKFYWTWKAKLVRGEPWGAYWEGEFELVNGTGRFTGIKGKGTFGNYSLSKVAPMQAYSDWEIEVELP